MEELGYLNPPAAIKCRAPPWVSIAVAWLHQERSVTSWTLRHGGHSHLTAIFDRDCSLSICKMSLLMTGVSSPYQIWLWDENECRGMSWWWCSGSMVHEELRVFNVWPSDPFYGSRWATWMPYLEFTIFTYAWMSFDSKTRCPASRTQFFQGSSHKRLEKCLFYSIFYMLDTGTGLGKGAFLQTSTNI
jgi:hypothetical protein